MSDLKFLTYIQLESNTEENWISSNIILKKGELVCSFDSIENPQKIKIKCGDGITTYSNLPYLTFSSTESASMADVNEAINTAITGAMEASY